MFTHTVLQLPLNSEQLTINLNRTVVYYNTYMLVPRRLLVLHSFYNPKTPSGENDFVRDQVSLLSISGFQVESNSENLKTEKTDSAKLLFSLIKIRANNRKIPIRIYDLIILHNIFPKIGIRKYLRTEIPIIRFVHNFRSICISGNLFRDGIYCDKCVSKGNYSGVINRCYKKSYSLSLFMTIYRSYENKLLAKLNVKTVFLSEPSMKKITATIKVSNPNVISNFANSDTLNLNYFEKTNNKYVYIGRLSHEKGILELVKNWPPSLKLDIYGSGPLENEIRKIISSSNIQIKGLVPHEELASILKEYRAGIFPSLWGEVSSIALRDFVSA